MSTLPKRYMNLRPLVVRGSSPFVCAHTRDAVLTGASLFPAGVDPCMDLWDAWLDAKDAANEAPDGTIA